VSLALAEAPVNVERPPPILAKNIGVGPTISYLTERRIGGAPGEGADTAPSALRSTTMTFPLFRRSENPAGKPAKRDPAQTTIPGILEPGDLKAVMGVEVKKARRYGYPVTMLLIEIDDPEGASEITSEELAADVAEILQRNLRESDVLGHDGDGRFACLLPYSVKQGARIAAERLRRTFEVRHFLKTSTVAAVTVSIGIAQYDEMEFTREDDLLAAAGKALERAKRAGGNRVVVHHVR
jgi:diguanylate cyclase (GGDEF)-like protein